jgi:CheY-like chemotaxis protein
VGDLTPGLLSRVTVVDDNDEFVAVLADVLRGRYDVTSIRPQSIADISATVPELMLIDALPGQQDGGTLTGWQLVEHARNDDGLRNVPIILCTGQIGLDGEMERMGQYMDVHLLAKPFDLDVLEATLARAMTRRS